MPAAFPDIQFNGQLRPSQAEVVEIARQQLADGERQLHIVAPPGSGKTVTGLYLWAEVIKQPALVLCPNSAIQSQWAARTDLFSADGKPLPKHWISTETEQPGLLTSLTYQSVTLPSRDDNTLDTMAVFSWVDQLIEKGEAKDPAEAQVWIESLQTKNPHYYHDRLSFFRKKVRDEVSLGGDTMKLLHASALATLKRLRDNGLGLVILDECHHLMSHWGRVMAATNEFLGDPIVLGLTATPPEQAERDTADAKRYRAYFGPVDYEVPVPAVVKDGFLAPYQDLAYFVRPLGDELEYITQTSETFDQLVEDLCNPPLDDNGQPVRESMIDYTSRVLAERDLIIMKANSWNDFEARASSFATAGRLLLDDRGVPLPDGVPDLKLDLLDKIYWADPLSRLLPVLTWYIRHGLRRSDNRANQILAKQAIHRLRLLGTQITETGTQQCASPVSRILAYSRAKARALIPILQREQSVLGDAVRAVVICDYEKTSAVSAELTDVLDDEAGGAIAAFRELLTDEATDALDPVLITGSTVLVDDDLRPKLESAARQWLTANKFSVDFVWHETEGFHILTGKGSDWCPRVYVELITELFQQGITRCLVGTRGLLGEGWDANKINVLIDLTCVTTSMTINQLRGRSFRLDPNAPEKLANNWDVVCIAPEFKKGLDDYHRFRKKHKHLFGVTDDGCIEKGVGHVHAAFTEIKPEGVEENMVELNRDMLERVDQRPHFRSLWKIGEPYHPEPILAVEKKYGGGLGFKALSPLSQEWTEGTLTQAIGRAVIGGLAEAELLENISWAEAERSIHAAERTGGYVRIFLENADEATSRLFAQAMADVFGPVKDARYVIQRQADFEYSESRFKGTWLLEKTPEFISRFIEKRSQVTKRRRTVLKVHAVPKILARNKDRALIFQKNWNLHVSPGNVWFHTHDGTKSMLQEASEKDWLPDSTVHQKEVFM
ncbi:MAG: DEAD/DEAH box helicase family protein [Verrucomicrobia subdivision 3 bacterium]|nr:DEAD/DEAH box helicase family protein [Limisphaerales bacterium]